MSWESEPFQTIQIGYAYIQYKHGVIYVYNREYSGQLPLIVLNPDGAKEFRKQLSKWEDFYDSI